jgi:hypothetical protein
VDSHKGSNKLISIRNKIIYFIAIALSGPIFLLMRYRQQGQLRWLDFVGAASGVIIGFTVFSVAIWYVNRN